MDFLQGVTGMWGQSAVYRMYVFIPEPMSRDLPHIMRTLTVKSERVEVDAEGDVDRRAIPDCLAPAPAYEGEEGEVDAEDGAVTLTTDDALLTLERSEKNAHFPRKFLSDVKVRLFLLGTFWEKVGIFLTFFLARKAQILAKGNAARISRVGRFFAQDFTFLEKFAPENDRSSIALFHNGKLFGPRSEIIIGLGLEAAVVGTGALDEGRRVAAEGEKTKHLTTKSAQTV
ncbi:hypothetical protein C8R45DRAFT_946441 [Mycena sanguinolenta]|nr:hypothetical protein C8R45DRAFT_946441 [Mycena sanguinolenta]